MFPRFHTYETQTMPVVEHYQKLGLVRKIQAIKSPEEVGFEFLMLLLNSTHLISRIQVKSFPNFILVMFTLCGEWLTLWVEVS